MSETTQFLLQKLVQGEPTAGKVFKPTPEISIFMTILMSVICWGFVFLVFFVFFDWSWSKIIHGEKITWVMIFLLVIFCVYFFYYTFLSYLIFPLWLKKKINDYFIYVGPEGVIRKDYFRTCFIPWTAISGAGVQHTIFGGEASGLELDIYLKNHQVWTPMLINSYAYGSLWHGLVTYRLDDMYSIAQFISQYAAEAGYKKVHPVK